MKLFYSKELRKDKQRAWIFDFCRIDPLSMRAVKADRAGAWLYRSRRSRISSMR